VLSGNVDDGTRLIAKFAAGRAWMRKDATALEFRDGIDRALARRESPAQVRRIAALLAIVALVIVLGLSFYLLGMRR
jgi:hypothetical protein